MRLNDAKWLVLVRAMRISSSVLIAGVCLCLSGCADKPRQEAREFLEAYHAIDIDGSLSERRGQLTRLRGLELSVPDVNTAAHTCLEAHNALLVAEEEQAQANHALTKATEGSGAERFDAAQAASLSAMLKRSNENVERARKLFPNCERAVRTLSLKYEKRR